MHNKTQKINDQLIKANTSNQEQNEVIILNLRSLKIGKIENLDWLINLEELNLSHNSITKMENLSKLRELRELNLSDNYIKQIQGIDQLQKLSILNLNGNSIQEIELSNQSIETLKLSRNQIKDLLQLLNLKILVNLKNLSISDNPFYKQYSYNEYLCFLIPTLQVIDNKVLKPETGDLAKMLYGSPLPSDQQQLQQNIRLLNQNIEQLDTEIDQAERKMQKAASLIESYKDVSDSDDNDDEDDKELNLKSLQKTILLNQELLEELQFRKKESAELLQQQKGQLEQYKIIPKPNQPSQYLNKLNSLFVRLQALLSVDLSAQQRIMFEAALVDNQENMLISFYQILDTILERIPLLPQEQAIQEASEQIHNQIQELYCKITLSQPIDLEQENGIEKSIILLRKLFKRAEKKYKKIDEFHSIKNQFLRDFEQETQQLSEKWKDYEFRKQQLKDEKEQISQELEDQLQSIIKQKEELKKQHQEIDYYFQKSNQDFNTYKEKQMELKDCLDQEILQLQSTREELFEQNEELKVESQQLREMNAEREESIRLLNEEIEMLQQRIQEQYGLNFQIREEQQEIVSNIEFLTNQKMQFQKDFDELQYEIDTNEKLSSESNLKYQQEHKRMKGLLEELEQLHNKVVTTEQLCREADKVLKQLNLAIKDKEDEMDKYDKIVNDAIQEKEKNKLLKTENTDLRKEIQRNKLELDSLNKQYQQQNESLSQAKKNYSQIQQLTGEKEQELIQIEKELINLERHIQDIQKQKENSNNDYEILLKEIKKLNIDKAKLKSLIDDANIDLQSLKQEYQIQQQNLQSLDKQIDLKVTELSSATHYHKNELGSNSEQMQLMHQQLLQLQEGCDQKGYEFKQLVDQIENLNQKRESLVKEVYNLQQQVLYEPQRNNSQKDSSLLPKPYISHDEESLQSQSYERLKQEWFKPPRHLAVKSQSNLTDYPRVIKPRSANHSLVTGGLKRSPFKDQSVQSVIQNLEELNQNLDRMYMESLERQGM